MPVVDHKSILHKKQRSSKRKTVIFLIVVAVCSALLIFYFKNRSNNDEKQNQQATATSSVASNSVNGTSTEKHPNGFYTGEQFQELYDSLAFPNTTPLSSAPVITGNPSADKRIQTIAESRGYVLRSVPVLPIVKTDEPRLGLDGFNDDLLQPLAYDAWLNLEKAAKADGIPLQLNSGYRSIETQRELFLGRLRATGVSETEIVNGSADNKIVDVLSKAAPPGYSRHHTGYTIDLFCNDGTGSDFDKTACFDWLKEDNYQNAKNNNWIPSYPEDASDQGPEPEPWEYVWIDQQIL